MRRWLAGSVTLAVSLGAVGMAASGAQAAYPGRNGRIAYVQDKNIHTVNPDGSDGQQLTQSGTDTPPAVVSGRAADRVRAEQGRLRDDDGRHRGAPGDPDRPGALADLVAGRPAARVRERAAERARRPLLGSCVRREDHPADLRRGHQLRGRLPGLVPDGHPDRLPPDARAPAAARTGCCCSPWRPGRPGWSSRTAPTPASTR